ncbi:hypothetical protein ZWY2020_028944 [Hordeum vulgare]|nr:hypothetical protein ZWY2020_028944 [Hordeum vulgare]
MAAGRTERDAPTKSPYTRPALPTELHRDRQVVGLPRRGCCCALPKDSTTTSTQHEGGDRLLLLQPTWAPSSLADFIFHRLDGAQPNLLVILYLDFKLEERYTPSKIFIWTGVDFHNIKVISLF